MRDTKMDKMVKLNESQLLAILEVVVAARLYGHILALAFSTVEGAALVCQHCNRAHSGTLEWLAQSLNHWEVPCRRKPPSA